jgi:hypothetical protein
VVGHHLACRVYCRLFVGEGQLVVPGVEEPASVREYADVDGGLCPGADDAVPPGVDAGLVVDVEQVYRWRGRHR